MSNNKKPALYKAMKQNVTSNLVLTNRFKKKEEEAFKKEQNKNI